MSRAAILCAAAVLLTGCDRGVATTTRPIEVRGLPPCKGAYARPLVVRLDRERSLFDEAFSTSMRVETPAQPAILTVPRTRMHAVVRVGLCSPTSMATWDCHAAAWLATTSLDLDARAAPAVLQLPPVEAACAKK